MTFFRKSNFYVIFLFALLTGEIVLFLLNLSELGIKNSSYFFLASIVFVFGFFVFGSFFFFRFKGINVYTKIIEKITGAQQSDNFTLSTSIFPEEDELGNLGSHLNNYTKTLKKFDELKKQRIFFERQKLNVILDLMEYPILITNKNQVCIAVNTGFYEEFKFEDNKKLLNAHLSTIITNDEFTGFAKGFEESNEFELKKDVNCTINNVNYTINVMIKKIVSDSVKTGDFESEKIQEYLYFFQKKHRSIFSK